MQLEKAIEIAKKEYDILLGYSKMNDAYIFSCSDKKLEANEVENSDIWIEVTSDGTVKPYYPFKDLSNFSLVLKNFKSL